MTQADEGRRVLRNVAAIGAFALSPVQMFLLIRALGAAGYGRWWSTFVIIEAAGILGMLGAELFVRRELPTLAGRDNRAACSIVGSSLALAGGAGIVLAGMQVVLASPIAHAQGDTELATYLAVFAAQPVLLNLTTVLAAALQSRDVLLPVALVRGLGVPLAQCAALLVAWRTGMDVRATLGALLAATALGLVVMVFVYARHFPIGRTLAAMFRPARLGDALRYGLDLFVASVLLTVGGKLDLYVLGAYSSTVVVALYGAALQMGSGVPNMRLLFDPIIQKQIGALHREPAALAASLRRLGRLCAFALAPAFVVTVAVGEPILSFLVGDRVDAAIVPLTVLCVGHLLAYVAVASWLAPMFRAGRPFAFVAGATLVVKLGLLLVLVPRYGATGAALATSAATVLVLHGQALIGGRVFSIPPVAAGVVPIVMAALAIGAGGRLLYVTVASLLAPAPALLIAGSAAGLVLMVAATLLMTADERAALARVLWCADKLRR